MIIAVKVMEEQNNLPKASEDSAHEQENTTAEQTEDPAEAQSVSKTEVQTPRTKLKRLPNESDEQFLARFNEAKQREIERLGQEIAEKTSRDTKKKRRNWWIKTGLMLALIAVSVAMMFTITSYLAPEGTASFTQMVAGASLPFFLIFIGVVVLYMVLESLKYAYLLKISTGKWRFKNSTKTMFLGKYYDGITPLGTGGQPFQIYYLHKKDIPAGVATAVPLVRFIVGTIVFCLIAVAFFVYAGVTDLLNASVLQKWGGGTIILTIATIAMVGNLLIPVIMLVVSLFPRFGKKMMMVIIKALSKLRIVKHKYPTMKKYIYEMEEYRQSLKLLIRKWWELIPLILLCVVDMVMNMSIPFFAVMAIAGPGITAEPVMLWLQIMCLATISFYSSSFVPTPGNSGASEAMTTLVFLSVSGIESLLGWIVLLWRFATYYLYILSGIGISIFEIIRSAVRNRRALKKSK